MDRLDQQSIKTCLVIWPASLISFFILLIALSLSLIVYLYIHIYVIVYIKQLTLNQTDWTNTDGMVIVLNDVIIISEVPVGLTLIYKRLTLTNAPYRRDQLHSMCLKDQINASLKLQRYVHNITCYCCRQQHHTNVCV